MEITLHNVWIDDVHFYTITEAAQAVRAAELEDLITIIRAHPHLPAEELVNTVRVAVYADPFGDRHVADIVIETTAEFPCCEECGPTEPVLVAYIENRAA